MSKIQIGLDVKDEEYASKIQSTINSMNACEFFVVSFENEAQKMQAEYWISDGTNLQYILNSKRPVILMMDAKESEAIHWNGERLDPYIPVRKMLKQMRICIKNIQQEMNPMRIAEPVRVQLNDAPRNYMESSMGKLLTVYSPIGGCGKSTLAITLCESMAEIWPQQRILYFNLEGASDWPIYFQTKGEFTLSDFLYSMLLERPDLETAGRYIEDITLKQESGVYFIEPCNVFEDIHVLDENEIQLLIDVLRQHFDYIVCDLNSAFHTINNQFLKHSNMRFLVSNGTRQGECKIEKFNEAMRQLKLDQQILGPGTFFVQIGSNIKMRNKNQQLHILPLQKDLYVEKNGYLCIRHNSEWYKRIKGIAEEVFIHAGT